MPANFGVLASYNRSAPDACNCRICESMVGSVTSYDSVFTTILSYLSPNPSFNPLT